MNRHTISRTLHDVGHVTRDGRDRCTPVAEPALTCARLSVVPGIVSQVRS